MFWTLACSHNVVVCCQWKGRDKRFLCKAAVQPDKLKFGLFAPVATFDISFRLCSQDEAPTMMWLNTVAVVEELTKWSAVDSSVSLASYCQLCCCCCQSCFPPPSSAWPTSPPRCLPTSSTSWPPTSLASRGSTLWSELAARAAWSLAGWWSCPPAHLPGRPLRINLMSRYICFSQNGRFDVSFEELFSKVQNPGGFFRKNVF